MFSLNVIIKAKSHFINLIMLSVNYYHSNRTITRVQQISMNVRMYNNHNSLFS